MGYVCQFQVYTGKLGNKLEKSLGERVVKDLTQELVHKFYIVYFDNYFNSVQLMRDLLQRGVYACGTVRSNRKDLSKIQINEKDMMRGESQYKSSYLGVTWLKWKDMDKRVVTLLSIFHNGSYEGLVGRRNKFGGLEEVVCPEMVIDYNTRMGCVDRADQLKSYYEISRKSKKFWHRLFFHFLDLVTVNSFILFNVRQLHLGGTGMNLKDFRLAVVAGLLGASQPTPRGRRTNPKQISKFKKTIPLEKRFDQAMHMPVRDKSRRCTYCSTKNNPHRTKWACSTCKEGLCLSECKKAKNCFVIYHEK